MPFIQGAPTMRHHYSSPAAWVVALLAATSPSGSLLAASDKDTSGAIVVQPSIPIATQNTPPATPAQEQPEVLSRGPVHEAFDEPVSLQPQTGLIAPSQPPPNIEEVPPAERPEGQQFVWIPGYWSWDADRNSYIWVSACWRVAPPNMSWVPGYWSQVSGGWEWVAGFWAPAGVREIEYLPAPPATVDMEPLGTAPSPDTIWVPPCMYWVQGRYARRAGYWLAAQPNWVWVPSHYVVTPRGHVFAEGHWDYPLERRGVLFAPVCFPASTYGRADITYSPSVVIDVGLLRASLFAYPRYSHYYFGDYYDDSYVSIGIFPWFDSRRLHTWYDPVYEHDRWQNQRSEPRWEERERSDYNRRRADKDLRPARTYREQESRLAKLPEPQRRALQVAQPIAAAAASRDSALKFERINTDARQKISKQAAAVRTFRDDRNRWEAPSAVTKPGQTPKEHKAAVTPPAERQENVQPPKERQSTVTPQAERRPTAVQPPRERGGAVAAPAAQREPAPVPSLEARAPQSERVQIPVSPIVGRSGTPGIFQKGPPARPSDEGKDNRGNRESAHP